MKRVPRVEKAKDLEKCISKIGKPDPGLGSQNGHLTTFGGVVEYPGLEKMSPDSLEGPLGSQKASQTSKMIFLEGVHPLGEI